MAVSKHLSYLLGIGGISCGSGCIISNTVTGSGNKQQLVREKEWRANQGSLFETWKKQLEMRMDNQQKALVDYVNERIEERGRAWELVYKGNEKRITDLEKYVRTS